MEMLNVNFMWILRTQSSSHQSSGHLWISIFCIVLYNIMDTHIFVFADLLVFLPTDYGYSGKVNYTTRNIQPFYENVEVRIIASYAGTDVISPAGPAIGCTGKAQCLIIWKIDPGNSTCPCAFNISCCENGVSVSFWWNWDLAVGVSRYRYFLDLAGIYIFYKSPVANLPMISRVNRGDKRQWYIGHSLPYGSWQHVTIMLQSNEITVYYNGRYNRKAQPLSGWSTRWYPDTTRLHPRFILKRVQGNYSFSKLHMWKNKQTALFCGDSITKKSGQMLGKNKSKANAQIYV